MKNALKKQLREKAKEHKTTMGVLAVTNTLNGKQYIQASLNLEALVNKMRFLLDSGLFNNSQLQKEWTESGSDFFTFEFVMIVPDQKNEYINYRKEIQKAEQTVLSEKSIELYSS
ncbi:LuxR family transcriptional regulator [Chryseobacterium sp. CH21]|uniref:GIY-YIG nuclease family protein n=1 Tax=Chryseobacterium sp. CH21 TaxID=713556 RepID=UPI00100ADA0E|nr:GIY-YIG nuclease family protein [Chryseobacterium sp. CH21]RXM37653.1 LuxR family transcriptional regulator [Chryseobacterium sp. CH21]